MTRQPGTRGGRPRLPAACRSSGRCGQPLGVCGGGGGGGARLHQLGSPRGIMAVQLGDEWRDPPRNPYVEGCQKALTGLMCWGRGPAAIKHFVQQPGSAPGVVANGHPVGRGGCYRARMPICDKRMGSSCYMLALAQAPATREGLAIIPFLHRAAPCSTMTLLHAMHHVPCKAPALRQLQHCTAPTMWLCLHRLRLPL